MKWSFRVRVAQHNRGLMLGKVNRQVILFPNSQIGNEKWQLSILIGVVYGVRRRITERSDVVRFRFSSTLPTRSCGHKPSF